jgi:AcrR family transcriptional regulator
MASSASINTVAIQERKERQRAERHRLIISMARELAEAEGWDAVTTRRLSQAIEYSQPVLYSHFSGKDGIVTAVALEGFEELAAELGRTDSPGDLARAYLKYAEDNPAVYDAMFTLTTNLKFAHEDTPEPLKAGFEAILRVLKPIAGQRDLGILTELTWSTLHGLATLTRGGRLPEHAQEQRIEILVSQLQ